MEDIVGEGRGCDRFEHAAGGTGDGIALDMSMLQGLGVEIVKRQMYF